MPPLAIPDRLIHNLGEASTMAEVQHSTRSFGSDGMSGVQLKNCDYEITDVDEAARLILDHAGKLVPGLKA